MVEGEFTILGIAEIDTIRDKLESISLEKYRRRAIDRIGKMMVQRLKHHPLIPSRKVRSHFKYVPTGNSGLIVNDAVVEGGSKPYSLLLLLDQGHRVLTSKKAERWWFSHLKKMGGVYHRKTSAPFGSRYAEGYHFMVHIYPQLEQLAMKIATEEFNRYLKETAII